MSAPNDPNWPFVSTDKRPLFFNPQQAAQTAPHWSEPWTYSDTQLRKRRRSDVEEVPAYTQPATQTTNSPNPLPNPVPDPTQQQPARKVRITPAYRASRSQERSRLSGVGEYINAWAAHIFSGFMPPVSAISAANKEAQHPEPARQPGHARKHVHQKLRQRRDPKWTAVLQDMDGEVDAFEARKHGWKESQQVHSSAGSGADGDVEMTNVDDETEYLEEEILHLRHRYNVLADSARHHHPSIGIKFFTKEELLRSDLPPPSKTRPYQATVRDENEEEAFERGVTRGPPMPGSYPLSPPREATPTSSNVSSSVYSSKEELHDTLPVVIDSEYGFIYVPAEFGQTVTNDTMNDSTDSSFESDDSASDVSTDSSSDNEDAATKNSRNKAELNSSVTTPSLQYPELPVSTPTLYTLPSHLVPARVPRSNARPRHIHGHSTLTKLPTGTADAFDQRRALLRNLNNPVTEKHASSQSTIENTKRSNPPVIPQITVEPPSNSSRSSSTTSIDPEKLSPLRRTRTLRKRGGNDEGQKPNKPSTSMGSTGVTRPSSSAPRAPPGASDTSKTTPKFQKPSSTNILAGPRIPASAAVNKSKDDASKTGQKPTKPATAGNSAKPAASSSFTPSIDSGDATNPAQKPGSRASIPGLGNSILGKKKTTPSPSGSSQTASVSRGKQQGTSQDPSDIQKQKNGASDRGDAVFCPECTFANLPNAKSSEMCKAAFIEDMSSSSNPSHLHIPGAFPGSGEERGDEEMQDTPPSLSPISDEPIVLYRTPAALRPTNPDHYATGGAGPRGTLGPLGSPLPVSNDEAERLVRERENLPRGARGLPYFNERIMLSLREQQEYAEIHAWEARKQERWRKLEQQKWDRLPEKEKQKILRKQEQEKLVQLELKAAEAAEAEHGSGIWQMLGF